MRSELTRLLDEFEAAARAGDAIAARAELLKALDGYVAHSWLVSEKD